MPALQLLRKPWVLLGLAILVVAGVILGVALARSPTAGCSVPLPQINLPAQLRTVGELAQPFELSDPRALADASVRAATALHGDLAGASADSVDRVRASGGAKYDAVVVPLSVAQGSTGQRRVVAVVAWLLDCSNRAYYDDTRDLLLSDPGLVLAHFPAVTRDQAAAQLNASATALQLVYQATPFDPLWRDPSSGATIPAGAG